MMILGLFLNLLIFALIIFGIKKLFSKGNRHIQKEGGVRRFFQLGLLFGLTIISAIGVSGLLGRLIPIEEVINTDRGALALESSFTFVGFPLFIVIALWVRKTLRKDPEELATLAWNLYLTAISILSLVLVINAQMNLYSGLFTDEAVRGKDISQGLVWAAIWLFHFRMHNRVGRDENTLGEHLIGSLIGLAISYVGLYSIFSAIFTELIGFEKDSLIVGNENPLVNGLITLAVGAPVWFIYWIRTTNKAAKESLWYAYVLLIGVGGGLLSTLIPAALALDTVLVWYFGESNRVASIHFLNSPQLIGAALTGAIVLWYHRQVIDSSQQSERTDIRRIYEYLISAIGLAAASGGITMILVSIIQSISVNVQITGASSINTFLGAVTLIIVGGPVWLLQWRGIQKEANRNQQVEQSSIIRRVYLLILFGVVGVSAVIVLLIAAYITFNDLFQNGISLITLSKMRIPIGIFITAAVISTYHWTVYRAEKDVEVNRSSSAEKIVKIALFTELKIKDTNQGKLVDVLNKYSDHIRRERGCELFEVLIDHKEANSIYLYEVWLSEDMYQSHLNSQPYSGWREFSDPLILSAEVKKLVRT